MGTRLGEIIFATVLSALAAVLAAVVGFVGAIALSSALFSGEATESALVLAPASALGMAVIAFIVSFRKLLYLQR
jgi:hypothetical protein